MDDRTQKQERARAIVEALDASDKGDLAEEEHDTEALAQRFEASVHKVQGERA